MAGQRRQRFVLDAEHTPAAFAELCRPYGISRKTGDPWLARYALPGAHIELRNATAPERDAARACPR